MKAIIIKENKKTIYIKQVEDLTTKQFLELQKEAKINQTELKAKVNEYKTRISTLENQVETLNEKVADLYHQIAIDRGEEEE